MRTLLLAIALTGCVEPCDYGPVVVQEVVACGQKGMGCVVKTADNHAYWVKYPDAMIGHVVMVCREKGGT